MRVVKRKWFGLALLVGVLLAPSSGAFGKGIEVREGVTYVKRGNIELKADIVIPGDGKKMRPGVFLIHGGGWAGGSRKAHERMIRELGKRGYVAMTINYRLTHVAKWPAQIEDAKAGFKYFLENAKELGLDVHRIAVMGESAGGHLSLMLGLGGSEGSDEIRPRCIGNIFGPTDLTNPKTYEHVRGLVEALVGGKLEENMKALRSASPVVYVDRTDPAVLTFHGTVDPIVPFAQAGILDAALKKAQVPHDYVVMKDVGHDLGKEPARVYAKLNSFFATYLKPSGLKMVAAENFGEGIGRWEPTDKKAWKLVKVNGGASYYSLIKKVSNYKPKVRSPHNVSLLKNVEVKDFVLDVDMRSTNKPYGHQSLCLFFGYQDAEHFYYVHFGRKADKHANSVFLVNGKPRVSIAKWRTKGTDWSKGWHHARIRRDVKSGKIEVYFDDMSKPVMTAKDKTFTWGRVGVGSFDDKGDFRALRVWGELK